MRHSASASFALVGTLLASISSAKQLQQAAVAESNTASEEAYSLQLKVIESVVTARESARPGWTDVGEYVSGQGRANLITASGTSRRILFVYTRCLGSIDAAGARPLLAK
jgi:hypothetical protein